MHNPLPPCGRSLCSLGGLGGELHELEQVAVGVLEGRHHAAPSFSFGVADDLHAVGTKMIHGRVDVVGGKVDQDSLWVERDVANVTVYGHSESLISERKIDESGPIRSNGQGQDVAVEGSHAGKSIWRSRDQHPGW